MLETCAAQLMTADLNAYVPLPRLMNQLGIKATGRTGLLWRAEKLGIRPLRLPYGTYDCLFFTKEQAQQLSQEFENRGKR